MSINELFDSPSIIKSLETNINTNFKVADKGWLSSLTSTPKQIQSVGTDQIGFFNIVFYENQAQISLNAEVNDAKQGEYLNLSPITNPTYLPPNQTEADFNKSTLNNHYAFSWASGLPIAQSFVPLLSTTPPLSNGINTYPNGTIFGVSMFSGLTLVNAYDPNLGVQVYRINITYDGGDSAFPTGYTFFIRNGINNITNPLEIIITGDTHSGLGLNKIFYQPSGQYTFGYVCEDSALNTWNLV